MIDIPQWGAYARISTILVLFVMLLCIGTSMSQSADNPKEPRATLPKIVSTVDPEYTPEAKRKKIQGVVLLSLRVEPDGSIDDVKVVRSLGYGLDEKAVEAVRKWKFQPATRDDVPIETKLNVEVLFRIRN